MFRTRHHLKICQPRSEDLNTEPARPPAVLTSYSPWSKSLGAGLKQGGMAKGFSSVRVGSLAEKDTQLYAATYSVKHLNKQRLPGGAGLSVNKS